MTTHLIKRITNTGTAASQNFHKETSIAKYGKKGRIHKYPAEWIHIFAKAYPRFQNVRLPDPRPHTGYSLIAALEHRESRRDFDSKQQIKLVELSQILKYSSGKKEGNSKRHYPSAGGRYPVESYVFSLNTEGLARGIYHYNVNSHALEFMWPATKTTILSCFNQPWISNAPFLLVLTGYFWRNEVKYGNRGYRYTMMEMGHIAQNTYLLTEILGLGCCSIGGFADKQINTLLDLDSSQEAVGLVIACGHTKGGDLHHAQS